MRVRRHLISYSPPPLTSQQQQTGPVAVTQPEVDECALGAGSDL